MIRKTLPMLYALAALSGPAAADGFNWTGFHAGINAGYDAGLFGMPTSGSYGDTTGNYSIDGKLNVTAHGLIVGGQVGYDVLMPSRWLFGVEADADASTAARTLSAAADLGNSGILTASAKPALNWLGTVRGRVGYVTDGDYLFYATSGIAYGGVDSDFGLTLSRGASQLVRLDAELRDINFGWTIGAGVEHAITDRLSLRAEYLYADLGSRSLASGPFNTASGSGSGNIKIETAAHLFRVGLNYKID